MGIVVSSQKEVVGSAAFSSVDFVDAEKSKSGMLRVRGSSAVS